MKESSIAVFIDFENLALGARDLKGGGRFDIDRVLKRFLEKGRIVHKRAYSDWSRYRDDVRAFHALGIELIDIPQTKMSGKNSADIRMVVDAIDLCHTKDHVDTFALVTGDSDFSPLVSKLKENDKRVIGCGIKSATSQLLVSNCDEFIYYDDLIEPKKPRSKSRSKKVSADKGDKGGKGGTAKKKPAAKEGDGDAQRADALEKVLEIIHSLQSDYDPLWGSLVKQTVRRVHPGFQERHFGYGTFGDLLQDLEEQGQIEVDFDVERGNHIVRPLSD